MAMAAAMGIALPAHAQTAALPNWLMPVLVTDGLLLVAFLVIIVWLRRRLRARSAEIQAARTRLEEQNRALTELARIAPQSSDDFIPCLQQITELSVRTLQTDRASVWLYSYDQRMIRCVELFEAGTVEHDDGLELSRDDFPLYFQALDEEHHLPVADVAEDPRTKDLAASHLLPLGIESLLVTPIRVGQRTLGVFVNAQRGSSREWQFDERNFAAAVGDAVALVLETLEHRRAEQELRRSERYYRAIIENSLDVTAIFDRHGLATYYSPSVERVLGYTPDELLGRRGYDYVHPDDVDNARARLMETVREKNVTFELSFRFRHKDGSWRHIEARANNLVDDPAVNGVVMNLTDVTERFEAEEAVRKREEYFRALIENALDVIVILEMQGDEAFFRYVSPSTGRVLGYAPEELVGKSSLGVINSKDLHGVLQRHDTRKGDEAVEPIQVRVHRADGALMYMEAMTNRLTDETGTRGIVLNLRDVTERRIAEDTLRAARRRLRAQNNALAELARITVPEDGNLEPAMRTIAETATLTMETSRASVWLMSEDGQELTCVELFDIAGAKHQSRERVSRDACPACALLDSGHRIYDVNDVNADSRTAPFVQSYFEPEGIVSVLYTPIRFADRVGGVVCHEHRGDPRVWQPDEINFAAALSDIIALLLESVERRQAQRSLLESEARAGAVLDGAVEGVITANTDGIIQSLNPAIERLFGYTRDELVGRNLVDLMPSPYREEQAAALHEGLNGADDSLLGTSREVLGLRKDGSTFPAWMSLSEVRVGAMRLLTSIIHDLTERKAAEEANSKLFVVERELEIARQIQLSILPQRFPPFPDRKEFDVFARMLPARSVAGDFYDFFLIDDRRLGFVVGDVSGKGVPASIFMAVSRTILRATAVAGADPGDCLRRVNRLLYADNPSKLFVTLVYGILDVSTGDVTYAVGGHQPPYVLSNEGGPHPLENLGGIIVGAFPDAEYTTGATRLNPGDSLVLFTDGVTEAMDANHHLFGEQRLEDYLRQTNGTPLDRFVDGIVDAVRQFSEGMAQHDDITLLTLRYLGSEETEPA